MIFRRESVPAEAEEAPAAGNLEEDETMDVDLRGDEDDDDMELGMIERLDHCIRRDGAGSTAILCSHIRRHPLHCPFRLTMVLG